MNVSIIGAAGHCGRQVSAQLLDERLLPPTARSVTPAQVALSGEWLDIHGVVAAPVIIGLDGWASVYPLVPSPDEAEAIVTAANAIASANEAC
jgi:malate/lactate dehydrogenase